MPFNPHLSSLRTIESLLFFKTTHGATSFAIPCEILKQKVWTGTIMILTRSASTFDELCILSSQYHSYDHSSHCFTSSDSDFIIYCIGCTVVVRITHPKTSHCSVPQHRIRIDLFSPRMPALPLLSKESLLSFPFRFYLLVPLPPEIHPITWYFI